MRPATLLAVLLLALFAVRPAAAATQSAWAENPNAGAAVRLIAATTGTGERASLRAGLQFRLDKGWKVYWREAGTAGYPPRLDWGDSRNLASADMRWPMPERFTVLGVQSIGYAGDVVYPLALKPETPGAPLRLRAHVRYLACKEVCVPGEADLALDLPAGPAEASPHAHTIERWLNRVPGRGTRAGLAVQRVAAGGKGEHLRVVATAEKAFDDPDLFVEGPDKLAFGVPETTVEAGGRRAVFRVPVRVTGGRKARLAGRTLTLTLVDAPRALETRRHVTRSGTVAADTDHAPAFATVLGFALLGGLILNIMPCVLPVLSIKLLSVIGMGGAERRGVRLAFLASAAGIVATFLVMGGALAGLKTAGAAIGWGIQFQQPLFLVFLATIVVLFACNLLGLYEIPLPRFLAAASSGHGTPHSLAGHALSGAFATLLATPCSAPFLGTAVGFALSRQWPEILAVFGVLGVGMAVPYFLVAAVPMLATHLPRPGPWMTWVRRVLGLALVATAAWLLWVLAGVAGRLGAGSVALALLLAVGRLGLAAGTHGWRRYAAGAVTALLLAAAFWVPESRFADAAGPPSVHPKADKGALDWRAFRPARIDTLVDEGHVVLVDVTADWCLTCQVNEANALHDKAVVSRLKRPDVALMRGDWTRPDQRIADYLARFNRYGIPFNAVYGPGVSEPILLPEVLTPSRVLEAVARASR